MDQAKEVLVIPQDNVIARYVDLSGRRELQEFKKIIDPHLITEDDRLKKEFDDICAKDTFKLYEYYENENVDFRPDFDRLTG